MSFEPVSSGMDLETSNALKHVYGELQVRRRLAASDNISNFQLFYNRLMSEYSTPEKKSQSLIVPLTGLEVDNFYARRISREAFLELIRTKVRFGCFFIINFVYFVFVIVIYS